VRVPPARAASLRRRLLAWWDAGHRDLPWRFPQHGADPYRVWIAEVMLQQTQVAAVIPYYRRFVERFPTLERLAAASEEEVLALWSGLGYYARGRRLRVAAQEALARHGGLPPSAEALAALPGFGPYTAGAVASIAFALPAPAVDGNVARVLARLFAVDGAPEAPEVRARLWALAAQLVPAAGDPDPRPGDFNQALMELGATVCGKPAPRCERCPLSTLCEARKAGREREIPPARARRAPTALEVACAVVERSGALLFVRRASGGLFGGLWELPSAEVPPGAAPRAALAAGLAASLGLAVEPGEELASVERLLTHRRLRLTAYRCRGLAPAGEGGQMVAPDRMEHLGMATAMRRLVEAVQAAGVGLTQAFPARAGSRRGKRPPGRTSVRSNIA
jgi:A/G-specific adenine glycosylase